MANLLNKLWDNKIVRYTAITVGSLATLVSCSAKPAKIVKLSANMLPKNFIEYFHSVVDRSRNWTGSLDHSSDIPYHKGEIRYNSNGDTVKGIYDNQLNVSYLVTKDGITGAFFVNDLGEKIFTDFKVPFNKYQENNFSDVANTYVDVDHAIIK